VGLAWAVVFGLGCGNAGAEQSEGAASAPTAGAVATGGSGGTSGGLGGQGGVGAPIAGAAGTTSMASSGGAGGEVAAGTGGEVSAGAAGTEAGSGGTRAPDGMRDVLLVGNSVAGTVSFIDAHTFESLGHVNVIQDLDAVMADINLDLVRALAFPVVQNAQLLHHFEPAAGERYVDDIFVSPAGDRLFVSRSNLGDVAAFDLTKPGHPVVWRTFVESPKADHATMSPDGKVLVVSATGTSRVAQVFDTSNGAVVGSFPTGYYPHQNDYSADGKHIYNSSIGNVAYQSVPHAQNDMKGDRWLVKVDATTLEVVRTWVFEYGIRPNVITPDESVLYTQLSYLNGVVKYDLNAGQELARSDQDLSEFALSTYATYDEYPHDSAHHGLALSSDGKRLCDCGTIDNTVAIIATDTMQVEHMIDVGMVPYWATTSPDGKYCFVSISGDDVISVIDYEEGVEVRTTPTGNFPQRSRLGRVPESAIQGLIPGDG
jgi:DNA-binding beta-propeller fold protein YncE